MQYLTELAVANTTMQDLEIEMDKSTITAVASAANAMIAAVAKLGDALAQHDFESTEAQMQFCANDIRSLMEEVRTHADLLETEVADDLWPLPKYREMLFLK